MSVSLVEVLLTTFAFSFNPPDNQKQLAVNFARLFDAFLFRHIFSRIFWGGRKMGKRKKIQNKVEVWGQRKVGRLFKLTT